MRYVVTLDGKDHVVELQPADESGVRRVRVGDREHVLHAVTPAAGNVNLVVDGESWDVEFEHPGTDPLSPALNVRVRGHVLAMEAMDQRRRELAQAARRGHAGGGPATLHSPMPGKVVKLLVAVGSSVKANQGVVVVEAMKMENELKAPGDGVVAEIKVKEGQAVEAGAALVVLGPPADGQPS